MNECGYTPVNLNLQKQVVSHVCPTSCSLSTPEIDSFVFFLKFLENVHRRLQRITVLFVTGVLWFSM